MSDASKTACCGFSAKSFSTYFRSFYLKYVIVLIALLIALAGHNAHARTLLVLGDSLSAGYGIALDKAWPSLLQARLARAGENTAVVNASISGDTTRGGLNRLAKLLEKHKPNIVMVELGANDGLRGVPAEHARQNLLSIIEQSSAIGAHVLLFEMKIPPNYGHAFAARYQEVYDQLAKLDDVTLVPFFLADVIFKPEMMQADGLHPTAAAQPLLLEHVWPYVETTLAGSNVRQANKVDDLSIDELTPY